MCNPFNKPRKKLRKRERMCYIVSIASQVKIIAVCKGEVNLALALSFWWYRLCRSLQILDRRVDTDFSQGLYK
jgi:hypothetical protein